MKKLAFALTGAAAAVLMAGTAWAGSLPSSKAAIVQGDLLGLATACVIDQEAGGGLVCDNPPTDGGSPGDTGFRTVMTTFIKTPNGKELAMDVGLQCGLITFTQAKAKGTGSGNDKADAEGRIQVRVALTPVDKDGATTGATFYALPNDDSANSLVGPPSADAGPDGVTYCFRNQELEVAFEDLVCVDDDDDECIISVSLLLETLDAHAFNFVAPNVTSGIKKIEVQARATAAANIFADDIGKAKGEAFVGMGSMLVETVRAVQAFDENTGINPAITELQ